MVWTYVIIYVSRGKSIYSAFFSFHQKNHREPSSGLVGDVTRFLHQELIIDL